MSVLIVYATQHGCTEKCAVKIKKALSDSVDLINIKKRSIPNLSKYDTIIIGGSIHAGKIQGAIRGFASRNIKVLQNKKLGLFLCCMEKGETAIKQFNEAFPEPLRQHAIATGLFGGEFNLDKMGFAGKFFMKKIGHVDKSISTISEEEIQNFIKKLQ